MSEIAFFGKIVLQFWCEFKYRFVVDIGIDLIKYANGHNNQKHFTIRKFSHLRKKSFSVQFDNYKLFQK